MGVKECTGTFEVQLQPEPPFEESQGVVLARATGNKRFQGALEGTSVVHMLSARTPTPGAAGYVALERITGQLEGRSGSFVAVHCGTMGDGSSNLSITIVPGSGTEGFAGIQGTMGIRIEDGVHHYDLRYALSEPANS